MGSRGANRNNVLAGLFLVVSIVLAVFIAFWVEDGIDSLPFVNPKSSYVARFEIAEGVAGIKPGSPVTVGGKTVGSVESIEYAYDEGGGRSALVGIDVALEIESGMVLYPGASVEIVSPLLGTLSSINISDIGSGDAPLGEGDLLDGSPAAGLADTAGLGDLARRAERVLATADEILTKIEPDVRPAMDDVRATLSDTRSFAETLRTNQEKWVTKTDEILGHADGLFVDTLPALSAEMSAGISDARLLVGSAQSVVDENRGDIRRTIGNLEGMSSRVRYDLLGRIDRVLDEGIIAAANMSEVGGRALSLIDRVEPPLVRTMSNFQLASGQATLLVEEVRAAPWRLLERPDEKEQREVVLFSAVRRYAESVEKLRDASEAMDSVLRGARAGGRELEPERVLRMNAELKESFAALQEAERALLGLIERETDG